MRNEKHSPELETFTDDEAEKLITSQMGHTDIAVTRDIYYHNRDSTVKKKLAISKAINF